MDILLLFALALSPAHGHDPAGDDRATSSSLGARVETRASLAQDDEFEERRKAAKGDVEKLWKLVDWCEARGLDREKRRVLNDILKLDEDDEKAHELLGHVFYDGQWFTSEKKLEAYKKKEEAERKKEEERLAKERGWVRYDKEWVHPDDVPFLERGWVKDAYGAWIDPADLERLEQGWVRQDLEWIPPDEAPKIEQGLWKCGEEWLSLDAANAYHAELGLWWRIPGDEFILYTTCPRDVGARVLEHVDACFDDLERFFGLDPAQKPHLLVVGSADQFRAFAAGEAEKEIAPAETAGLSSIHGAFFADIWIDFATPAYLGAGVALWDLADPNGESFGPLFARHAAGLSYAQAIDPSKDAVDALLKGELNTFTKDFQEQKRLPPWMWYGVASYVERYGIDRFVKQGGDPHWARKWALDNIGRRGGMSPLSEVFDFQLSADDVPRSELVLTTAGFVVAFVLDGGCKPVQEAHAKFKAAVRDVRRDPKAQKDLDKAIAELEKTIQDNQEALQAFADACR